MSKQPAQVQKRKQSNSIPIPASSNNNSTASEHESPQPQMTLENLMHKHSKLIYEMIGKKPKNALDFEWTSIQNHSGSLKYSVEMQDKKKFDYNPETHEIIWYKNLNIPAIRVCKKTSLSSDQNGEYHNGADTKIMAIRGVKERSIQQVGLLGQLDKTFEKEQCVFNHLRFKETYFQYKRSYFSLVVVISEHNEETTSISEIKISTPIRVEARKKSYQDRLNTSFLLDPFLPDFIEKQYMVVKQGAKDLSPITENLEGLLDYLKAQNIRHKVFHPFFFLIKFFKATQLYYNTNIIEHQNGIQPSELFELIQKEIYKSQIKDLQQQPIPFENKLMIICLNNQGKDNQKNKVCEKITKFLKFLENSSLYYSQATIDGLPEYFKQIQYSREELKEGYIKAYNKLSSLKFEMVISKQNNTQSHISIQKKGQIPGDLKRDKDQIDYLNNIPGPFHKAIFDLTIRNKQLYLNAQRMKVRYEDFNLFSYEIHEDSHNEMFGPSLIKELPLTIAKNNKDIQKILEKKKQTNIPGSVSATTKPSSSDSNNGKGNSQSGGCEIENSYYNNNYNYSYSNSSLNDRQYKQKNVEQSSYEDNEKNSQISKIYMEGEEDSSSKEQKTSSQNIPNKKFKNHKLSIKNGAKPNFKRICTENTKSYQDYKNEHKYRSKQLGLKKRDEEEENGDLDEEDNDDEYPMHDEEQLENEVLVDDENNINEEDINKDVINSSNKKDNQNES